jgi:diguanylate cyclase (GGDEF)-like protein
VIATIPRLPYRVIGPLVTGVAFYAAAAATLLMTRGVDGLAALWPANGILLAALLIARRRDAWLHVAAATVASFLANEGAGVPPLSSAGYSLANIVEALVAWRLVQERGRTLPSFVRPEGVARFFCAAFAAALASATLATLFDLSHALAAWSSWVTTDLVGILVVTPVIIIGARLIQLRAAVRPVEATVLLVGVAAVTALSFGQSTYPLTVLPLAALLVATLRLGPFGAAAGVMIVAAIGSYTISTGTGRLVTALPDHPKGPVIFFQFYLLVLLASSLPLAALLAARDRLVRRLAESNRLLHLAEQSAGLGHWRIGTGRQGSYCSPEVMRLHGLPGDGSLPLARALASYHPDDRARIIDTVRRALREGTSFAFDARLLPVDGEERRVHSRGFPDRAADGTLLGLFGTVQDVTRQIEGQHALEAARTAAEQAARIAMIAAETDALTGLPNRRKIALQLDEAIAAACVTGRALSVAMIDLDHFKEINDRFGHLTGDEVLVHVARAAEEALRGADVVGRMGGEEFVILLPRAAGEQASAVAERVRVAVAALALPAHPELRVTASIGVATYLPGETAAALLGRADAALYAAKDSGRNTLRHAA